MSFQQVSKQPLIVPIQSAALLSSQTILIWLLERFRGLERSFRQWIERLFLRSRSRLEKIFTLYSYYLWAQPGDWKEEWPNCAGET